MSKTISRRDFLKGTAAGALGLATAGMLGACSNNAGTTTTTTNNDPSVPAWLGTEPQTGKVAETLETEVLVIGTGTAGWPAALTAAENGAKVMLIERNAMVSTPKDDIGAVDSKYQLESLKTLPYLAIDRVKLLKDAIRYSNGYMDSDLFKLWIEESAEAINWYGELLEKDGNFKMWHEAGIGNYKGGARDASYATGHSPQQLGEKDKATVLTEYATSLGVEIMLETKMVKLVKTGDRVTGIIAENAEKGTIQINASKGVIVCTGGYTGNPEMLKALQPETVRVSATGIALTSSDDGSGIKAALWAGADMDQIHASCKFNRAAVDPKTGKGGDAGVWYWFGEQPFMRVNTKGVRFCNESGPYDYVTHSMSLQPGAVACHIFDSNAKKHAEQMERVGCCRLFPFDNGAPMNIPFDAVWGGMNQGLIDSGHIVVANTLEELAEGLNIPVEPFLAQVKRYNEYAKTGVDEEYGKVAYRITPIDTAPYYAAPRVPTVHHTMGGVEINENTEVLDVNGNVIPGLFAAGEVTGGIHGENRLGGNALTDTVVFGRIAGNSASAFTK